MHPHTTTTPAGHDLAGYPILNAITLYPDGKVVRYGPMRSCAYSLLHARASKLGHVSGPWSESVASELQRAVRLGMIEATTLRKGAPAAARREAAIRQHQGSAAGFAAELERRKA